MKLVFSQDFIGLNGGNAKVIKSIFFFLILLIITYNNEYTHALRAGASFAGIARYVNENLH